MIESLDIKQTLLVAMFEHAHKARANHPASTTCERSQRVRAHGLWNTSVSGRRGPRELAGQGAIVADLSETWRTEAEKRSGGREVRVLRRYAASIVTGTLSMRLHAVMLGSEAARRMVEGISVAPFLIGGAR